MGMIQATETGGAILIVFNKSSILDELAVQQVGRELDGVVDKTTNEKVVVDLGRVEMMTSSMIGRLVKFKKRCDADKIELVLCNLSKEIAKLFKMTRLDKVFKIKPTREKALK